MRLPPDLRLALSPTETYRQLIAEPVRGTWLRALERPALVAVIIGTAVTLSSARRVPLGLVLMGIRLLGLRAARPVADRPGGDRTRPGPSDERAAVSRAAVCRASSVVVVDAGDGRAVHVHDGCRSVLTAQVLSLLVPAVWTTIIVSAFCRTALGCTPARARMLTVAHQAMTWTAFFAYVFLVVRILAAHPRVRRRMSGARILAVCGLAAGVGLGTLTDTVPSRDPITIERLPGPVG